MNKLVILTDLGTFKAYRMVEDRASSSARLEPVDAYETECGDDRISRKVSDDYGNQTKGSVNFAAINDGASGEPHNLWQEEEKRSVRMIVNRMNELLDQDDYEGCYFAASNEINNSIVDNLNPKLRGKIEKNVHKNLVNAKREEILSHFQN